MPYIDTSEEPIFGWYDESNDHFLCNQCFYQEREKKRVDAKDYKPILENNLKPEDLFICDECGER